MKAIVFHEHGGPDVLRFEEAPEPETGRGQVKIKVHACCLNHLDVWVRKGVPGPKIPMPHIPGSDMAGEVLEAGEGAEGWKAGDRVVVSPGLGCGDCIHCRSGDDSSCAGYAMLGWHLQGGWCERQVVDARRLIAIGDRWTMEEWASAPLVFLTAWHMLFHHAGLRPGEVALVHAAGSGVGSAAIQLAKLAGARVVTTAGSDEKCRKALDLGADLAVNYRERAFDKQCRDFTGGRGVDVIIDHIGAETFEGNLRAMAKGGRMVTCGNTSGAECSFNMGYLFVRQLTIKGSFMGGLPELMKAMELLGRGDVRPVVDRLFPLERAAEAVRYLEERRQFGKVVLKV